ncbi:hypothetical protein M422DRAFT_185461 [Sphaerobolus stellatus SS14]|uniref:HTH CENPB-type domain-containing protein n=1 Tax=Sphaerobolus stellatus (strain SS14) TaxID=990650 RepID=A0A0C9V2P3_SPHS4|nr:hypothetical protein M422DRAFT_185461 [Sphaerobolus stellatus SS14]
MSLEGGGASSEDKENRIQRALAAFRNGKVKSIRSASNTFNVPFATLQGRLNGRQSHSKGHETQRIITEAEELSLIDWCLSESRKGRAWTRLNIRERVYKMKNQSPSDKWVERFLVRHADQIEAARSRPLDPKRARAFNPKTVNHFFDLLESIIQRYQIPVENIYNTDEKGLQLGGGKKASTTQRIFAKGDRHRYVLKSDSLLLITIIETVSADGEAGPPCIIMPKSTGPMVDWLSIIPELGELTR